MTVAALVFIGLLVVYSASFVVSIVEFDDSRYFVMKQAFWAVVGLSAVFLMSRFDYRLLRAISPLLMLAALVGLVAVLVPGVGLARGGASRWIALGPLPPIQPSEFAKLAVIIYVSAWLSSKRHEDIKDFAKGFFPFIFMVGIVGGLIVLEPDTGTAAVVVMTTVTLFFVAGASLKHIAALVGSTAVGATLFLLVEGGYRADRIFAFTSAESDPTGKGFHTLQLLIALGSGGINGLGLGASRQKFFYVPNAHTDGIFAIIGEEMGFIGATIVILLFVVLFWRIFRLVLKAPDDFGSYLCVGILTWIGLQMLVNIGGATRSIPMTGIPLPFLSYGGSALASTLVAIGIVLSVSRRTALAPMPARSRSKSRSPSSAPSMNPVAQIRRQPQRGAR